MSTATVHLDQQGIAKITNAFLKPLKTGKDYFNLLAVRMDQLTQLTFKRIGARGGHPRWKRFSQKTLHPSWMTAGGLKIDASRWNRRPGTDRSSTRRYSASSQLLQASGGFKQAFNKIKTTQKSVRYGLKGDWRKLGKSIMSDPDREVLFVTPQDIKNWQTLYAKFYSKRFKV